MRNRDDFDKRFESAARRHKAAFRVILFIQVALALAVMSAIGWALGNPEKIGQYLGRIVSGFTGA